jgi:hypothetical protein
MPCTAFASPFTRVGSVVEMPEMTFSFALDAPESSTPASRSHDSTLSAASVRCVLIVSSWLTSPPSTSRRTTTPSTMNPSSTMVAPAARGSPRRCSQPTRGIATVAPTTPTITGTTMTAVSASS